MNNDIIAAHVSIGSVTCSPRVPPPQKKKYPYLRGLNLLTSISVVTC